MLLMNRRTGGGLGVAEVEHQRGIWPKPSRKYDVRALLFVLTNASRKLPEVRTIVSQMQPLHWVAYSVLKVFEQ